MGSSCKVFEGKAKGRPFFFLLQFYFLMKNDLQCVDVGGTFVSSQKYMKSPICFSSTAVLLVRVAVGGSRTHPTSDTGDGY